MLYKLMLFTSEKFLEKKAKVQCILIISHQNVLYLPLGLTRAGERESPGKVVTARSLNA